MSDDTPTQRFDVQPAPPEKRASRLALILGISGGVLLLLVILLLVLLLRGQPVTQAASATDPTPTVGPTSQTAPATPTPTASTQPVTAPPTTAPPAANGNADAAFTNFVVQKEINGCPGGTFFTGTTPQVHVTWATVRAHSAWIVQGTSDAAYSQFMRIPVTGNQSQFPYSINFDCNSPSSTYTITLVGTNGKHVSKSWTIKNTSPGQAAPLPRQ